MEFILNILNKKIYRGFNGSAGEIGHTALIHSGLPCSCGRSGCWETYASVTALVNQTKIAMHKHPESLMNTLAKERGVHMGRPKYILPNNFEDVVKKYRNKEITNMQAIDILKMNRGTFFKYAKEYK